MIRRVRGSRPLSTCLPSLPSLEQVTSSLGDVLAVLGPIGEVKNISIFTEVAQEYTGSVLDGQSVAQAISSIPVSDAGAAIRAVETEWAQGKAQEAIIGAGSLLATGTAYAPAVAVIGAAYSAGKILDTLDRPVAQYIVCASHCGYGVCDKSDCGSGCCDESGICQTGTSIGACGTGGNACSACADPASCGGGGIRQMCGGCDPSRCASGKCAPDGSCQPRPCEASNCPTGCCDTSGGCQAGTLDVGCGLAGAACVECVIPDSCGGGGMARVCGSCAYGQSLCGSTCCQDGQCSGSTCGGIDAGLPDATDAGAVSDASDGGLSTTSSDGAIGVDPIPGNWDVTYGSPSVVTISGTSASYTMVASSSVQVTGAQCSLPPGTQTERVNEFETVEKRV